MFIYSGETQNDYPHGQGILMSTDSKTFTGTWEKGLRTGKGTLEVNDLKLVIKYKKGKIYRVLEFINKGPSRSQFIHKLDQPNYIKEGNYFKEIPSNCFSFIFISENKLLFHGLVRDSHQINSQKISILEIFRIKNQNFGIKEIRIFEYRLVGHLINTTPVGCSRIFKDQLYFKTTLRGHHIIGTSKIVKNGMKMIFKEFFSEFFKTFRIISKAFGINIEVKLDFNNRKVIYEPCGPYEDIIKPFVFECFDFFYNFSYRLKNSPLVNRALADSLNVEDDWGSYEKNIAKNNRIENNDDKKIDFHIGNFSDIGHAEDQKNNECVKRVVYKNGFYFGEVKNGKKHGLGCFSFSDGSRYHGYFRNDKICGKGFFISGSFRVRGEWVDGKAVKIKSISFF